MVTILTQKGQDAFQKNFAICKPERCIPWRVESFPVRRKDKKTKIALIKQDNCGHIFSDFWCTVQKN